MPKEGREGAPEWPEHPLFPIEEGTKSFEVSYIQVARKEGGAMCFCPQVFRAEELTTLEQITERFGGGTYELYARNASPTNPGAPARITKRRMVTLAGRPKPIDPSNATMQEEVAAGIRPSPFDAAKPTGGLAGDSGILVAILQMGQQSAQRAQEQSMQFMTMFMQMMQSSKQESAQMMTQMMSMMTNISSQNQQSMMQMIPLLVAQKGGGPEEITKWVETMKSLGFGKAESSKSEQTEEEPPLNVGEVLSNVAEIVKGAPAALDALKSMGPGAPPNGAPSLPTSVPGAEPPPGSAAAVLAGKG